MGTVGCAGQMRIRENRRAAGAFREKSTPPGTWSRQVTQLVSNNPFSLSTHLESFDSGGQRRHFDGVRVPETAQTRLRRHTTDDESEAKPWPNFKHLEKQHHSKPRPRLAKHHTTACSVESRYAFFPPEPSSHEPAPPRKLLETCPSALTPSNPLPRWRGWKISFASRRSRRTRCSPCAAAKARPGTTSRRRTIAVRCCFRHVRHRSCCVSAVFLGSAHASPTTRSLKPFKNQSRQLDLRSDLSIPKPSPSQQ